MQKLKTKKKYDNLFEVTKDGKQILWLNEELSNKIINNDLYKALLTQFQYDNGIEVRLNNTYNAHIEEKSKPLEIELLRNNTIIEELPLNDIYSNFYKKATQNTRFRPYNVSFNTYKNTPYPKSSKASYQSLGDIFKNYKGLFGCCS